MMSSNESTSTPVLALSVPTISTDHDDEPIERPGAWAGPLPWSVHELMLEEWAISHSENYLPSSCSVDDVKQYTDTGAMVDYHRRHEGPDWFDTPTSVVELAVVAADSIGPSFFDHVFEPRLLDMGALGHRLFWDSPNLETGPHMDHRRVLCVYIGPRSDIDDFMVDRNRGHPNLLYVGLVMNLAIDAMHDLFVYLSTGTRGPASDAHELASRHIWYSHNGPVGVTSAIRGCLSTVEEDYNAFMTALVVGHGAENFGWLKACIDEPYKLVYYTMMWNIHPVSRGPPPPPVLPPPTIDTHAGGIFDALSPVSAAQLQETVANVGAAAASVSGAAEAHAQVLEALKACVERFNRSTEGINFIELAFAIMDLISAWREGRMTAYALISAISRFFSATGTNIVDAFACAYKWFEHTYSPKEVCQEDTGSLEVDTHAAGTLGLAGTIASGFAAAMFGTSLSKDHLKSVSDALRFHYTLTKSAELMGPVSELIEDVVPKALSSVVHAFVPAQWVSWFYSRPVFDRWMADLYEVTRHADNTEMINNVDFQLLIISKYERFRDLLNTRAEVLQWRPPEFRLLKEQFAKLEGMFKCVAHNVELSRDRVTPTCVWIYGPPGVGKSVFFKAVLMAMMGVDNLDGRVYYHNVKSKHMNGYHGQDAIALEELGQDQSETGLMLFIMLVNTAPYLPEMASIEPSVVGRKGQKVTSRVVGVVSNKGYPVDNDINDPDAVFRRRDLLIHMTFKGGKPVDLHQLSEDDSRNFRHAEFYLKSPRNALATPLGPFDAAYICRLARRMHVDNMERQEKLVDDGVTSSFVRRVLDEGDFSSANLDAVRSKLNEVFDYRILAKSLRAKRGCHDIEDAARLNITAEELKFSTHAGESPRLSAMQAEWKVRAEVARVRDDVNEAAFQEKVATHTAAAVSSMPALRASWIKLAMASAGVAAACAFMWKLLGKAGVTSHAYAAREVGRTVAKPTVVAPVPVVHTHRAVLDEGVWSELEVIRANTARLQVGFNRGHGVFVKGRLMLTARHVLCDASGEYLPPDTVMTLVLKGDRVIRTPLAQVPLAREWVSSDGPMDMVVLDLSKVLAGDFKDIRSRFWTNEERGFVKAGSQWVVLTSRGSEPAMVTCNGPQALSRKTVSSGQGTWVLRENACTYEAACNPGDSGCVVASTDPGSYRLIGIHVGGREQYGVALAVTREDLSFAEGDVSTHALEACFVRASEDTDVPGLSRVGHMRPQYPVRMSDKTCIEPSDLAIWLPPSDKAPAALRPFIRDGVRVSPALNAMRKMRSRMRVADMRAVREAAADVVDYMERTLLVGNWRLDPLGDVDAIFGTEEPYVDRINPDSSAGVPCKWRHPGKKGKRHLFDYDARTVLDQRVIDDAHALEDAYVNGKYDNVLATISLKDELRTLDRVAVGKTRAILVLPVAMNIVARKYLLRLCALFSQKRVGSSECQVGINATSDQWGEMYNALAAMGVVGFGGDTKNHDATLDDFWSFVISSLVVIPFMEEHSPGWDPRCSVVVHGLCREWSQCHVICNGVVYQKAGVLPTGAPVTVVWNTLEDMTQRRYVMICMCRRVPVTLSTDEDEAGAIDAALTEARKRTPDLPAIAAEHGGPLRLYNEHQLTTHYGDDNGSAVGDVLRGNWGFQAVKAGTFAYIGAEITPPDKGDDTGYDLVPIAELEFLKRGFRFDSALSVVGPVAPLAWSSVVSPVLWRHKTARSDEVLAQNIDASLREALLHGKASFLAWRKQICEALRMADKHIRVPSHEELCSAYTSTGFSCPWIKEPVDYVSCHAEVGAALLMGKAMEAQGQAVDRTSAAGDRASARMAGAASRASAMGSDMSGRALDAGGRGMDKLMDIALSPLNLLDKLFDKPNRPVESTRVIKQLGALAITDGATHHDMLTNNPTFQFVQDPASVGRTDDPLDIAALASKPALRQMITVNTSAAYGDLLGHYFCGPFGEFVGNLGLQPEVMTPFAYAGLFCDLFRGPTKFVIDIFAPQHVSFRLKVAFSPGTSAVPTMAKADEGYFKVLDINTEHQQFIVECRYIYHAPFWRCEPATSIITQSSLGIMSLFLASSINAPSNVPTTFYIAVSSCAGEGCMFVNPSSTPSIALMESPWVPGVDNVQRDALAAKDYVSVRTHSDIAATVDPSVSDVNEEPQMQTLGGFGATVSAQATLGGETISARAVNKVGSKDVDDPITFDRTVLKMIPLANLVLASNEPLGTVLISFLLPGALPSANRLAEVGWKNAVYFVGGYRITITCAGARFAAGSVIVFAVPIPVNWVPGGTVDLRWATSLPHVIVRVNAGQTQTLELPWNSIYSAYHTKFALPAQENYRVCVATYAPVQQATGAIGQPSLQLYGQVLDGQFSVPDVTGNPTVQTHSDMSTQIPATGIEVHEGAVISALSRQAPPRSHAAQIRSLHDVAKRFTFIKSTILAATQTIEGPANAGMGICTDFMAVRDLVSDATKYSPLTPLAAAFGFWSGELNLKFHFYPVRGAQYGYVGGTLPEPELWTAPKQYDSWIAFVGYCPHPRMSWQSVDYMHEFAIAMGGFKGHSGVLIDRPNSSFIPLGRADSQHPWCEVVVPFISPYHGVFIDQNVAPEVENNPGYVFWAIQFPDAHVVLDESELEFGVDIAVAAGDSFRFSCWRGTPTIHFRHESQGSLYPGAMAP